MLTNIKNNLAAYQAESSKIAYTLVSVVVVIH